MFFGKGDTLEGYLRKKDPEGFKGWDGHAMRVYAVKTKAQKEEEMLCVVLVNDPNRLHRVYVVTPNSQRLIKGGLELWGKFKSEYLPDAYANLDSDEPSTTLD